MKPLYIFDLDGTLALIDHRRHLVECEKPNWKDFFAACIDDEPNQPVIDTLHSLIESGAEVFIWSGRSSEVMEQTRTWLQMHIDDEDIQLCMRVEGDFTPDEVLKQSWLEQMPPCHRRRLIAVFDDRDKVVSMWRKNGVACFQVAPGDF